MSSRGQRAFTVLLAVLLVGGLVAPITATEPAAAQDGGSCTESAAYLLTACSSGDIETTTYDGDPAATQTTLHGMAVSEWESQKAVRTILENYGEDTQSIASLEARNAIATAYEQGNTSTTADDMARDQIADYYSLRQLNSLRTFEKSQAQVAHIGNITNEQDIDDDFVYAPVQLEGSNSPQVHWYDLTGEMRTKSYTLANGTTVDYNVSVHRFKYTIPDFNTNTNIVKWSPSFNFSDYSYNETTDRYQVPSSQFTDWHTQGPQSEQPTMYVSGQMNVRNSYVGTSKDMADGLPGQKVHDLRAWDEIMSQWDDQSASMLSEYVDIAPDLYNEMDAGNLDPNELRGAEGMVRYLSGDSNATEGDYRTALQYTLDTSNPNLTETSTMRVHIDGYTGITWNESTNSTSREPIPTDPMNSTIEGLLFAEGVASISSGETYNTTPTDNSSFYLIQENGTQTTLVDGELTVEAIYDADGNEVDNASYNQPKYDSYDPAEFISYLEENEEARAAITSDSSSGGGGLQLPDLLGNNPAIGMAVVGVVVVLFVVGKASD